MGGGVDDAAGGVACAAGAAACCALMAWAAAPAARIPFTKSRLRMAVTADWIFHQAMRLKAADKIGQMIPARFC